jgi:hypothetical protein
MSIKKAAPKIKIRWEVLKISACIGSDSGKRLCFILCFDSDISLGVSALCVDMTSDMDRIGVVQCTRQVLYSLTTESQFPIQMSVCLILCYGIKGADRTSNFRVGTICSTNVIYVMVT